MVKLIIIILVVMIILKLLFTDRKKIVVLKKGKISGMIYNKFTKLPVKGAVVKLGKLDAENGQHSFTTEKDMTVLTDENGKFSFEGIEIKSYWVYAENTGKKVLKIVKLTKDQDKVEDVLLMV